jgi:hypothetical protein
MLCLAARPLERAVRWGVQESAEATRPRLQRGRRPNRWTGSRAEPSWLVVVP